MLESEGRVRCLVGPHGWDSGGILRVSIKESMLFPSF